MTKLFKEEKIEEAAHIKAIQMWGNSRGAEGERIFTKEDFRAGVEFAEKEVLKHVEDIIIENQGLKLNQDLAIEFADFIGDIGFKQSLGLKWTTELLVYSGCIYSTKELFELFLKERKNERKNEKNRS